ncbi:hypothetical protein NC651_028595 [Populus alba x Populus x berolinensis]|nr:hypothetical protein NC651_028595 [Populus alba x Populus x berolinensis]
MDGCRFCTRRLPGSLSEVPRSVSVSAAPCRRSFLQHCIRSWPLSKKNWKLVMIHPSINKQGRARIACCLLVHTVVCPRRFTAIHMQNVHHWDFEDIQFSFY